MEGSPHVPITRHRLESLSTGELVKLADSFGIDISSGPERISIIEELLKIPVEDEQEDEDDLEAKPVFKEAVALPRQYNISFIEVMIRDPLWVFVYWEIKSHDRDLHEKAEDFGGYCLRVIPLSEGETVPAVKDDSFTVAVGADDSARYLGFPEHSSQTAGRYIVKLSAIRGASELPLVVSLPFSLPKLTENESICDMDQNPLIRLSGARDFSTIKSTDRQSRAKRQ